VNIATEGRDCREVGSSAELSKRSGTRKNLSARPSKDIYVEQKGWFFDLDSTLDQKGTSCGKLEFFLASNHRETDPS
jgi:hypothetical protein